MFRIRLRRWQNHASPTLVKMAERVSSSWAALCVFVLVWRALGLGIFAKVRDQPDGNLCILPFEIMTGSDRGKVCIVVIFHAQTLQAFSHLRVSILWDCRQELVTNVFSSSNKACLEGGDRGFLLFIWKVRNIVFVFSLALATLVHIYCSHIL